MKTGQTLEHQATAQPLRSGGLVRRFDFARCSARIAAAQQMMNIAPTVETTAYWCRIWRARRRIYRIASLREPMR